MFTAQKMFDHAFAPPREKRSEEYRAGVLAALRFKSKEARIIPCAFQVGTAQSDAYFAGVGEGLQIARNYQASSH